MFINSVEVPDPQKGGAEGGGGHPVSGSIHMESKFNFKDVNDQARKQITRGHRPQ